MNLEQFLDRLPNSQVFMTHFQTVLFSISISEPQVPKLKLLGWAFK